MEKAIAELKDTISESVLQHDIRSLSLRLTEVEKKANSLEAADVRSLPILFFFILRIFQVASRYVKLESQVVHLTQAVDALQVLLPFSFRFLVALTYFLIDSTQKTG